MHRTDFHKRKDIPSASQEEMRSVLRHFATGVTLVTASTIGALRGSELYGITVSSFASISLEPPIVMVAINNANSLAESIVESEHFAVHILSEEQQELADRFASSVPSAVKYGDLGVAHGLSGAPTIQGTLGMLDCVLEQTLVIGTHTVMFGRVVAATSSPDSAAPLLYYHRAYRRLE